ncbi:MAG: hypothetical protein K2X69_08485 [Silvanigrellaceae bacterium]|nr:hypothetical protein [Silvanigrellaceae bacterium]
MRALTNNTLVAISRYSNKVLKLATYMSQSEQPMLLDNVYMIDNNTSQKEALESFQKDFDKTVDLIEKSHQLLSTVRADGIVEQLDNNEKNLKEIFEDKYNQNTFEITLSSITINLKRDIEKDEIRNSIIKSVLGIDYPTFKDFIKSVDKIYKLDERNLETEEDAVEYLSSIAYREKYDEIINKIKNIAGEFSSYRKNLGLENRNLIDNEITFTRSMIDSVIKNSTYITKESIEQIASPHKKNMSLVNELHKVIKNNNYINAIELDQDTNLKSVLDVLLKTTDLKLNLKELFTLKCRKLGNYNANGLYLPNMHIAAVDITNPSALIHELTHAVDISNPELYNHVLREEIVTKYKQRINLADIVVQSRVNYFLDHDEIIARLGELSYLLNKTDFKINDTIDDFIEKARINDKDYNSDYLNIAKPIDEYLRKSNIYFNFDKMKPEDLLEIKEYFKSYFGINNDEIRPVYSKFISYEQKETKKARKVENKYKDSPFVKLDPTSIEKALNYNYENKIIPFDQLFLSIAENIEKIARRKKTLTTTDLKAQFDTTNIIYDWVSNKNDINLKVDLIKNFYILSKNVRVSNYAPFKLALKFSKEDTFDKVNSLIRACNNSEYLKYNSQVDFRKVHLNGLKKVLSAVSFEDILKRIDLTDTLTHSFLFSDRTLSTFSTLKNEELLEKFEYLLSIYRNGDENKVFDSILNQKNIMDTISFTKEQTDYLVENCLNTFKYGLRSSSEGNDVLGFSTDHMKSNLRSGIHSFFSKFPKQKLLTRDEATVAYNINYDNFTVSNILGKDKVVNESFKDIRKQLLEKALEEIVKTQEIEKNKKTETKSIVDTLKLKIEESKENIKVEEKEPQKPILADKSNQFKLF